MKKDIHDYSSRDYRICHLKLKRVSDKVKQAKKYRVIVEASKIKGNCPNHKIGDTVEFIGAKIKGEICPIALNALYPYIFAFKYGATFPAKWETMKKEDEMIAACPDPINLVTFKIRRVAVT